MVAYNLSCSAVDIRHQGSSYRLMANKMTFFTGILLFSTTILMANSLCNTCSATSGLACVDKDRFKVCVDGMPTSPAIKCPTGTVCTPNAQVCAPEGTTESSCARCNTCNDAKTFSCTDYDTFALCYGGDTPDDTTVYKCPNDLVCNLDSPTICVDIFTTGLGATCPWNEPIITTEAPEITTTTTPNPETQPNEFCESKKYPGRYELTIDATCQKYISCTIRDTEWTGNLYECPKDTFFNAASQMCGVDKPERCANL